MPDLPAFQHINNIIVMTPDILMLIFKPAVENSKKRLFTGESRTTIGVVYQV